MTHLTRAEVVRLVGISTSTNVLWLDEGSAERRLERHPWVAAAEVRSVYPRRVEISVVERTPVAVVVRGDRKELIAADGTMLGAADRRARLPRIEVPAVSALDGARLDVAGAAAALGAMTSEVRARVGWVRIGLDAALELRTRDGVNVRYGTATSPGRKAATLELVLTWSQREGEPLEAISLVSPRLPTVRLAD